MYKRQDFGEMLFTHFGVSGPLVLSASGCIPAKAFDLSLIHISVIVATGGISYPSTGATGDGYRMAEESGHKMVSPTPALVDVYKRQGMGYPCQTAGLC